MNEWPVPCNGQRVMRQRGPGGRHGTLSSPHSLQVLILLIVLIAHASCRPLPHLATEDEYLFIAGSPEEQGLIERLLAHRLRRSSAKWSYGRGADKWSTMFHTCGGQQQSPVDLRSNRITFDSNMQPFAFEGFDTTFGVEWSLHNNGHTVQVTYVQGRLFVSGGSLGVPYQVAQFHWHWGKDKSRGSEHLVDGEPAPMELHIVCHNTKYKDLGSSIHKKDGVVVLGFFYEISNSDNPFMQQVIEALPSVKNAGSASSDINEFALRDLMASTEDFYRYEGSLTTPMCNEVVTWTIFADAIPISDGQLDAFRSLYDSHKHHLVDNYRPVQKLNGRTIRASFDSGNFINSQSASELISVQIEEEIQVPRPPPPPPPPPLPPPPPPPPPPAPPEEKVDVSIIVDKDNQNEKSAEQKEKSAEKSDSEDDDSEDDDDDDDESDDKPQNDKCVCPER